MVSRQLPLHLHLQPLPGFVILAGGTVPVATRAVDDVGSAAGFAVINGDAAGFRAAIEYSIDDFPVLIRHGVAIAVNVLVCESLEDFFNFHHQTLS